MKKKISFLFHPFNFDKNEHVFEKSIDGKKKRYLKGIASGTQIDGHGEKITENCIKSFQSQASSGDILLYADDYEVAAGVTGLKLSNCIFNGQNKTSNIGFYFSQYSWSFTGRRARNKQ